LGYVDDYDASNVAFNTSPSGLGTGDVQSAINALAASVAGGIQNYNIISSTPFASSAMVDTLITGMTITPVSGTYAVMYNAENTGSGSGASLNCIIYKAGTLIADSLRKAASPAGTHEFTSATQTVAQFNGTQACDVRINPNGTACTVNQRSLLLIRLGP
jgi:hypothetical protein